MKSISYPAYVALLKAIGLQNTGSDSSHSFWDFPEGSGKALLRSLTIRKKDKDIPLLHMQTNLRTMVLSGVITEEAFEQMLDDQANPKAARARKKKAKKEEPRKD